MTAELVGLDAIEGARERVGQYVPRSPLIATASGLGLKAESLHLSGAFKLRGAFNSLLALNADQKARGVIAPSSGNHAQAVACAASKLGIDAIVVMPENSPELKREACRRWGAEVVIRGSTGAVGSAWAAEQAAERGLTLIHPYDSPRIVEGTGIIGLEILEDRPDVSAVYVPVSGGGLIAGVAAAIKAVRPDVEVIGVEPALADDAARSFEAGERVELTPEETARTIADGLRVPIIGVLNWSHIQTQVDRFERVTEAEIEAAMRWVASSGRLVAEPSGAVSVAAALRDGPVAGAVAIISGGNVDPSVLARILTFAD